MNYEYFVYKNKYNFKLLLIILILRVVNGNKFVKFYT